MNALLLPIVLGFLYLLARRLPAPYRLRGAYAAVSGAIIVVTVVFGVYSAVAGLWGRPQSEIGAITGWSGDFAKPADRMRVGGRRRSGDSKLRRTQA